MLLRLNSYKILGLKAYFSRCLTNTLPKRESKATQTKVFFVGFDKNYLLMCQKICKKVANLSNNNELSLSTLAKNIVLSSNKTYLNVMKMKQNSSSLRLCIVLHQLSLSNSCRFYPHKRGAKTRFSALKGIIPIYSVEDLKQGKVDFSPKAPDMEALKEAMLENTRLSILK